MAQNVNVVGLFEDAQRAPQVVLELTRAGFSRDSIGLLTSQSAGGNVSSYISRLGAPPQEAQFWAQGVQRGGTLLALQTTQDRAEEAMEIIDRFGAVQFADQHLQSAAGTATGHSVAGETVIPIVEEQLQVGKREVQRGGVRIYTRVEEVPVEQNVTLREEHVHVERHPVNRAVTDADLAAVKEGTIELTETSEQAVVSKQARVVEEVVVGKEATERTETVRDTVRRTDVQVEELDADDTLDVTNTTGSTQTSRSTR